MRAEFECHTSELGIFVTVSISGIMTAGENLQVACVNTSSILAGTPTQSQLVRRSIGGMFVSGKSFTIISEQANLYTMTALVLRRQSYLFFRLVIPKLA